VIDYSAHRLGPVFRFRVLPIIALVLAIAILMALGVWFIIEYAVPAFDDANKVLHAVQSAQVSGGE
jgi:hypothetical protein